MGAPHARVYTRWAGTEWGWVAGFTRQPLTYLLTHFHPSLLHRFSPGPCKDMCLGPRLLFLCLVVAILLTHKEIFIFGVFFRSCGMGWVGSHCPIGNCVLFLPGSVCAVMSRLPQVGPAGCSVTYRDAPTLCLSLVRTVDAVRLVVPTRTGDLYLFVPRLS